MIIPSYEPMNIAGLTSLWIDGCEFYINIPLRGVLSMSFGTVSLVGLGQRLNTGNVHVEIFIFACKQQEGKRQWVPAAESTVVAVAVATTGN